MAELLLTHAADPHATRDDGKTPAQLAAEKGHSALVLLLQADDKR
jgi:ankyrin repeat protein